MALFAQTKVDASGSASQGLLAALKGSLAASGAGGGLFASLLSETSAALPQVKPNDPLPVRTDNAPEKEVRDEAPEEAQETAVETTEVEAAPAEKPAPRKTEERNVQEKPALSEKEAEEETDVVAPEAEATETVETELVVAEEDSAARVEKDEKKSKKQEEEEILALLAALDPFDDSVLVQEAVKSETPQETSEADDEISEQITEEAMLALLALGQKAAPTETANRTEKTKQKETAQENNVQNAIKSAAPTEAEAALVPALEETTVSVETESVAELPLQEGEAASGDEKDFWSQLWARSVKAQGAEQTVQPKESGLAARLQETTFPANNNTASTSSATPLASTQTNVQQSLNASTTSGQVETVAATDGKGVAQSAGLGGGVRQAGSYDFASQLSATRVTRGGSAGLPQAVEQLAVQLHKTVKQGQNEMTIQLRPAELGKVEVKLTFLEDNSVQGTVTAEKASTLSLLQKDSDVLLRALQDAGLQADPGCLDFSLRGENGQKSAFADFSAGNEGLNGDAASLLNAAEEEASLANEEGAEIYYITPNRVNLRV